MRMAICGVLRFKIEEPKNKSVELEEVCDGCTLICGGRGGTRHGMSCDPAGGPSRLEVKATCEAIDIESFPCKIETRN